MSEAPDLKQFRALYQRKKNGIPYTQEFRNFFSLPISGSLSQKTKIQKEQLLGFNLKPTLVFPIPISI